MVVVFSGLRNTLFGKRRNLNQKVETRLSKSCSDSTGFAPRFGVLSMTVLYLPIVECVCNLTTASSWMESTAET